ncbi:hypothetical protein B005_1414 [Nocardiopsis alba ATCC BAA-2165]|uniref:Uncharacterized protein n=1 Tax=Nocardiopsis alba (strain ATCC BAA-2165 / BE74) TaxID=1205910 RepID=J7LGI5_NOCAA|nr:hypothetical protein B005_1414 [Nocardiopsis alba ATCC BAA-2165]
MRSVARMLSEGTISPRSKRELEEVSYARRTVQRRWKGFQNG